MGEAAGRGSEGTEGTGVRARDGKQHGGASGMDAPGTKPHNATPGPKESELRSEQGRACGMEVPGTGTQEAAPRQQSTTGHARQTVEALQGRHRSAKGI